MSKKETKIRSQNIKINIYKYGRHIFTLDTINRAEMAQENNHHPTLKFMAEVSETETTRCGQFLRSAYTIQAH